MKQPAEILSQDNRTDKGIPVFWTTLNGTFETQSQEELLKRSLKFQQSKQTTQTFQETNASTVKTSHFAGSMSKVKQEPIMAVGNRNNRRPNREQHRRKQTKI